MLCIGFVAFSISRFTIAPSDQTALFLVLAWRCLERAGFEEVAVLGACRGVKDNSDLYFS